MLGITVTVHLIRGIVECTVTVIGNIAALSPSMGK